ncbi:flagellar basal body rod protein FlgB [Acetobacter oeni]|uniref:Flagellar biosynthesis protein FlgB n=1 Tax=Acetobacter oeni TaxID=304077 RepID=A0A511XJD5_9PROT|nr:flagellar basal body protein [Acetobacter oeni]MBB3882755.1 flagellar basal-body rod protein FlgB [Acetobacter oeni]NHO18848.1 flagellar biosynthesis protein FlgB [Acetobacter oeni]GBR06462.1 flagellar basal-body rod protein FlgB [Acetobacter oeni LMG 21952]GEN63057.1 flagellar biosynthesis protein FlgB [Acetobacter oeni]
MLDASRPASGGTDLFDLAQRRMNWLEEREKVLANNVANADTPNYVAQDVTPFSGMLAQFQVGLATTSPRHIPVSGRSRSSSAVTEGEQSPNGNGISLETQMEEVAETSDQQRFATNVYSAYKSMLTTVLGK